jgi:transcriptional regulator GlxA family with amidase domain
MTRAIGLVLFSGFQILDLAGPLSVFETANRAGSPPAYRLHLLSEQGGAVPSSGVAMVETEAAWPPLDTVVVTGGAGTRDAMKSPGLLDLIRQSAATARRTASVCTGAFVLAAADLLDNRRATTHWARAATLQRLFRSVRVESDRIFVRDGAVWTSAGVTAGIDLALALVEDDLGFEASRAIARDLVVYHRRPGGQSQFSALLELDPPSNRIARALSFARQNLHLELTVERLAEAACLSPRQFSRSFVTETGTTPAKAIERLRAEAARPQIEEGRQPIDVIAREFGFDDPERMRRACIRIFGQPPQALRRAARGVLRRAARGA